MSLSLFKPITGLLVLKNKLPESTMIGSIPSDLILSIIVAFRARPPKGFFFQPQGSISPCTLEVLKITISELILVLEKIMLIINIIKNLICIFSISKDINKIQIY